MSCCWYPDPFTLIRADNQRMRQLLEEALHLGMNGEYAPGGNENWADWFTKTERYLRGAQ